MDDNNLRSEEPRLDPQQLTADELDAVSGGARAEPTALGKRTSVQDSHDK